MEVECGTKFSRGKCNEEVEWKGVWNLPFVPSRKAKSEASRSLSVSESTDKRERGRGS
jgi:hypothetical protein